MNNKRKEMINLIKCFENKNKYYWIKALKISEAEKGFLINYFELNK